MLGSGWATQSLILNSRTKDANIFINDCMVLSKRLIYFMNWSILKLLRFILMLFLIPIWASYSYSYIHTIIALLCSHLRLRFTLRRSQARTLACPSHCSFHRLLHCELLHLFRCWRLLHRIFIVSELLSPLLSSIISIIDMILFLFLLLLFFSLSFDLFIIFFLHITIFFIVVSLSLRYLAAHLREVVLLLWHFLLLDMHHWLLLVIFLLLFLSLSCSDNSNAILFLLLRGFHGRTELNWVDFIYHTHWVCSLSLLSLSFRVLINHHSVRLVPVWLCLQIQETTTGRNIMLRRGIRRLTARCLWVVFKDTTLIFKDQLGRGIVTAGKRWLWILKLAIKVVELKKQEVVLVEVKVLSGLQVDWDVILNGQVEDIAQIVHHFLSKGQVVK